MSESTMTINGWGHKEWSNVNVCLHREDGPAYEGDDGYREWRINGQLHRTDGPAVEGANGDREWWIDGRELTEDEFNARLAAVDQSGQVEQSSTEVGAVVSGGSRILGSRHPS